MKIKHKECIVDGCHYPRFAKGYCKNHQYLRSDNKNKSMKNNLGTNRPRIKKSGSNIAYRSKKRSKEEIEYSKICKEIDNERKDTSQWKCYFCGKPFMPNEKPEHHHLKGRDGDLLTDKKFIVLAHHKCHVLEYHSLPVSKIWWFDKFLNRLKKEYPKLYIKEKEKLNK